MLPGQQELRLPVTVTGRLAGQPIRVIAWSSTGWAGVDLSVGAESDAQVGVRGSTRLGKRGAEVGRFRVDGNTMRVFLQAIPLIDKIG